jgi:hypothetical protein
MIAVLMGYKHGIEIIETFAHKGSPQFELAHAEPTIDQHFNASRGH